ncbi:Lipid A biosynthesis lauroyl acyltransferase [Candidatus Deianiraea vastatrix]|uniref:Lipid A biosynthesis lauroyl acyltransferase n=1 Tax=Candidatus Deianiraea vastatrix TaxID=2163644 RepID=A0A5B8XHC8_9RICK|nr:Lipid A biosynthesis lauroyl acyltransferase [Candidatus Deianiraea vastatrix]
MINIVKHTVFFIRYIIEFIFLVLFFVICILFGFKISSCFGGYFMNLFRFIPKISARVTNNLRHVYPLMEEEFVQSLSKKIFFTTGRMVGETPHFFVKKWSRLQKYVQVENHEIIEDYIKNNESIIIITGHFGNWWFITKFIEYLKIPLYSIYRRQNNPLIDFFVHNASYGKNLRKNTGQIKEVVKIVLKKGNALSVFADHRDINGIPMPFLGKDAMTSIFFAKIACKYNIPVIYVSCLRKKNKPTEFVMKFQTIRHKDDDRFTPETLAQAANDQFSLDISENREQWFWLHKRWKMKK